MVYRVHVEYVPNEGITNIGIPRRKGGDRQGERDGEPERERERGNLGEKGNQGERGSQGERGNPGERDIKTGGGAERERRRYSMYSKNTLCER